MTLVAVAPNQFAKGFDGSGRKIPFCYDVLELKDALERTYQSDAHLVTYVVEGASRQPRINKTGLPHFDAEVKVGVFFCDSDNPRHESWNEKLLDAAWKQYDSLEVLKTAGVYHTAHGRRIVQPLEKPIPAQEVEPYLKRWLAELEKAGIAVDWNCRDWTRHFRLPNVRRSGRAFRCPYMRLDRMRAIPLAPIAMVEQPAAASGKASSAPPPVPEVDWSSTVPEIWRERIERIAKAVRSVESEWHTLFMALAGALLSRGVPQEQVPAICKAISTATGADTRTNDREASARSTVQRRLAGLAVTGYGQLAASWPGVARALDEALATGIEARLRAQAEAEPAVKPRTLEETTRALEDAIRNAPDGLTLISAECGLGKTAAAVRVAAERAVKPYATEKAQGRRAPPQSKTSIAVDTNKLALQIAHDLAASGTPVRRVFGPLSLRNPDETPVCRYHEVGQPLVAGGQRMQWELCRGRDIERCEHYEGCPAKDGVEGDANARITLGTHALIAELAGAAGTTGLLVIDELPELLESVRLTVDDFEVARQNLNAFDDQFEAAMRPALTAVREFTAKAGEPEVSTTIPEAIRACAHVIDPGDLDRAQAATNTNGDAVDCVAGARDAEHKNHPPPLLYLSVQHCRQSPAAASALGRASMVLGAIYRAVVSESPVVARVDVTSSAGRVLVVTFAREQLYEAMRKEGAVVVTAAKAERDRELIAKIVGYEPPLLRFAAVDGAPIQRTLLRCGTATRKGWFKGGQLVIEGSLTNAVRAAVEWAKEDPAARRMGLITMRIVELALKAALGLRGAVMDKAWREAGQPARTLMEAREVLGPILRAWPGEIAFAHYGAVRGLNNMADVDCLVTLGDPWPNLGEVRNQVAFLGLPEVWDARVESLCRAELEQAHGRLRTIHRKRPGRALHVGNVLPGGSGWTAGGVEFRKFEAGRPKNPSVARPEEVAAMVKAVGGLQKAADELGCTARAVNNYCRGERNMPMELVKKLHRLAERREQPPGDFEQRDH